MFSPRLYVFAVLVASWDAIATPVAIPTTRGIASRLPFSLLFGNPTTTLPEHDRARVAVLRKAEYRQTKRDFPIQNVIVPANNSFVTYTTEVGIGNPPTKYTLLIDTGSSNTWVSANKGFNKTSSTICTDNMVEVMYGSGAFVGKEVLDTVRLSDTLTIANQSIGVSEASYGLNCPDESLCLDGILGIGPTDLTRGTLFPDRDTVIPTVTDNLYAQGKIEANTVAISFNPITSTTPQMNGELTFGQLDYGKFTSYIHYVPITTTSPAKNYFGIDQSITYGTSNTPILGTRAGIVDTGTTLILIATDAFNAYKAATGAMEDKTTGLLMLTRDQYANLQSLYFNISGSIFELIPDAQIWPRALNGVIGGDKNSIYLVIADIGENSGNGLDFINGYTFLERFYSVFDSTRSQVGLATTPHTMDTTNY